MKRKLTKQQVLSIPKLLENKTIAEVAKHLGISWKGVYYWVNKLRLKGYQVPTRGRGRRGTLE